MPKKEKTENTEKTEAPLTQQEVQQLGVLQKRRQYALEQASWFTDAATMMEGYIDIQIRKLAIKYGIPADKSYQIDKEGILKVKEK